MKLFFGILAGVVLAALPVAGAVAQGSPPAPCTGTILTDAKGDESIARTPLIADPTRRTGETPNLDLRSAFVTYRDNVLTAHIKVTDLNKSLPEEVPPGGQVAWWFDFDTIGSVAYVKAVSDGTNVTFAYGDASGTVVEPKETKGTFLEGPDGVISIEFPADGAIKAGAKFAGVFALSTVSPDAMDRAQRIFADEAPDGDATKTFTVTECPAPSAAAPAPQATKPPATAPAGQSQPAAQTAPKPATKTKKKSCKAKAKKLKGAKRARALKKCKKKKRR